MEIKFNDFVFAIRYDLSGNPAVTRNILCPYCRMSHRYMEFYIPWTLERWFSIQGAKEKCLDYPIGEQMLNQEIIITPTQYLTYRLEMLLEVYCSKGESTTCHQEINSVTITEINRLIICPCTKCNNYHKIVPIYNLSQYKENELQEICYLILSPK